MKKALKLTDQEVFALAYALELAIRFMDGRIAPPFLLKEANLNAYKNFKKLLKKASKW